MFHPKSIFFGVEKIFGEQDSNEYVKYGKKIHNDIRYHPGLVETIGQGPLNWN